jgi:hypothetical protein
VPAELGRHVDQHSVALGDEVLVREVAAVERAEQVRRQHLCVIRERHLLERTEGAHAGVVDPDVEPACPSSAESASRAPPTASLTSVHTAMARTPFAAQVRASSSSGRKHAPR